MLDSGSPSVPWTQELNLDNAKNNFERNRKDVFVVRSRDVGLPDRLRIGHDNTGFGPGWHLDRVEVTNKARAVGFLCNPCACGLRLTRGSCTCTQLLKMTVVFPCGRWLAKDEDDGQTVRVLTPRDGKGPKPKLYDIEVYTSDVKGAGTDANVDVTLNGTEGSFGPLRLETSKNNFERNRCDKFQCECLVGELQSISIGHDGKGLFSAWHLNKVVVTAAGSRVSPAGVGVHAEGHRVRPGCVPEGTCCPLVRPQPMVFEHGDWIPKDGGGERYVTLLPSDGTKHSLVEYVVQVYTSDVRGAGTDATVTITLFGQGTRSYGPVRLDNSK